METFGNHRPSWCTCCSELVVIVACLTDPARRPCWGPRKVRVLSVTSRAVPRCCSYNQKNWSWQKLHLMLKRLKAELCVLKLSPTREADPKTWWKGHSVINCLHTRVLALPAECNTRVNLHVHRTSNSVGKLMMHSNGAFSLSNSLKFMVPRRCEVTYMAPDSLLETSCE